MSVTGQPPLVVDNRTVVPLSPTPAAPAPAPKGVAAAPSKIESAPAPKADDCCSSCEPFWNQIKAGFQSAGETLERFFEAVYKFFKRLFGLETPQEKLAELLKEPLGADGEKLKQLGEIFAQLPQAQRVEIAVLAWRARRSEEGDALDMINTPHQPENSADAALATVLLVEADPTFLQCREVTDFLSAALQKPKGSAV